MNKTLYIGPHMSSSGGYLAMGESASKLGANTFAFFTRNPRGGKAKDLNADDMNALNAFLKDWGFGPLVAHAPYTMNLCSDKEDIRGFARDMLADDLMRMEYLPGNYYNFHPGSHVGQGTERGIAFIAGALNSVLKPEMRTTVLLEGMAGKGSEIGSTFEELKSILDAVDHPELMGVCLDTCHLWEGGYDIARLDDVLAEFDRTVGLGKLKAIHLNDSKNPMSAHKDRHECLGKGHIGEQILQSVVNHPALCGLPFILETPNDDNGYAEEIRMARGWRAKA